MSKNLSQQHGANILGCKPLDGVLGVPCSNQINVAIFSTRWDTHIYPNTVDKCSTFYLIWTKNTQYPIYWFASKYASSMLLVQLLYIALFSAVLKSADTLTDCSLCRWLLPRWSLLRTNLTTTHLRLWSFIESLLRKDSSLKYSY